MEDNNIAGEIVEETVMIGGIPIVCRVPVPVINEQVTAEAEGSSSSGGDFSENNEQVVEAESSTGGDASETSEQKLVEDECTTRGGDLQVRNDEQVPLEAESSTGGDALETTSEQKLVEDECTTSGGDLQVRNDEQVPLEAESSTGGDAPEINEQVQVGADTSIEGDMHEINEQVLVVAKTSSGGGDVQTTTGSGFQESLDSSITSRLVQACMEIDQKLDPNLASTNYSVDEAIKNDGAPVPLSSDRTLCIQRVIDVMDHLLACEATWHHEMKALEQTVYSCYYIRRPERLSSYPLLHSFCMVTVLTCIAVTSAVTSFQKGDDAAYYNSSTSYGEEYLSMLDTAENKIVRQLKACRAPPSQKRNFTGVETLQTDPDLEEGFCKAVLCRLRFRKYFYRLMICMKEPRGTCLNLAKEHITSCLAELNSIQDYFESNSSCIEDRAEHRTTASGRQPVGFGSPVNSTRELKLLSWKKTVDYFRKLLQDLEIICSTPQCTDLQGVMRFMLDYHKRQPDHVALVHIQLYLVQNERLYGRQRMFALICKAALLPESAIHDDILNHEDVQSLGKLLSVTIKGLCIRISDQREILAESIVCWQNAWEKIDLFVRNKFGDISTTPTDENKDSLKICKHILVWVLEQKHWLARQFLLRGFDVELYSTSEYFMIYWCMCFILYKLSTAKRERIQLKNSSEDLCGNERLELSLVGCYNYLAQAFMMMFFVFRNEGKVPLFDDEEQRFIQLFEPLTKDGYSLAYASLLESQQRVDDLSKANEAFLKARDLATEQLNLNIFSKDYRLEEVKQIEYVAKRNHVALKIFGDLLQEPGLEISFDFSYHRYFPVVEFKRSSSTATQNM